MVWSPNTQLHYPFQNTALDYSGNARHGTVYGSGVYATRPNGGRCLYFDGVGDYVATPSFGLSGTVVVFAAVVRCKSSANYQAFIGDGLYASLVGLIHSGRWFNSTTAFCSYADGTTDRHIQAPDFFAPPYDDAWLHFCVVCDYSGKSTYFYRNGLLFYSSAMIGTPIFPATTRVKYIGSYKPTFFLLTDGYLQNVYLATLLTCPPVAALTANANRLMLGMNPIWSI